MHDLSPLDLDNRMEARRSALEDIRQPANCGLSNEPLHETSWKYQRGDAYFPRWRFEAVANAKQRQTKRELSAIFLACSIVRGDPMRCNQPAGALQQQKRRLEAARLTVVV